MLRSSRLELSQNERERRRPVWIALSELFLDTELTNEDFDRIAAVLASSRYTLVELEDILLWEVYPVCHWNLVTLAGEWAGFDGEWLQGKILERRGLASLIWTATVGRLGLAASADWKHIRRRVCHRTDRQEHSPS